MPGLALRKETKAGRAAGGNEGVTHTRRRRLSGAWGRSTVKAAQRGADSRNCEVREVGAETGMRETVKLTTFPSKQNLQKREHLQEESKCPMKGGQGKVARQGTAGAAITDIRPGWSFRHSCSPGCVQSYF